MRLFCNGNYFITWIILSCACLHLGASEIEDDDSERKSLYSDSDPILQLNVSNFDQSIFGHKKAFFIEFYSSWCGHCVNFAPLWKQFAENVSLWTSVVEIGAINCALDENLPVCRKNHIDSFPTIKYFKYNPVSIEDGHVYGGTRASVVALREGLVDLLVHDSLTSKPPSWPNLIHMESGVATDEMLWSESGGVSNFIAIVFSPPLSTAGSEALLDLSGFTGSTVVRLASEKHPLAILHNVAAIVPAVVVLKRGQDVPVFISRSKLTRNTIASALLKHTDLKFTGPRSILDKFDLGDQRQTSSSQLSSHGGIFWDDLLSALSYAFLHEIAGKEQIQGEQLTALQRFLQILAQYFPRQGANAAFMGVKAWVAQHTSLSGEAWQLYIKNNETYLKQLLPKQVRWMACKGSKPGLRGYTCGLWTLFHTLTVHSYLNGVSDPNFKSEAVAEAIRGYIYHFFGCRECAEHFEMEAAQAGKIIKPEDVVLWLWRIHNKANDRLRGDKTEDPKHQKHQFPVRELCSDCRGPRGQWDEAKVLEFLVQYYGQINGGENIETNGILQIKEQQLEAIKQPLLLNNNNYSSAGSFFSKLDFSLCVLLWCGSALLVAICCLWLKHRRRMFAGKGWKKYNRMV